LIIINSAAYVEREFRNEIGAIPPCLLPLGNKKLIEYQISQIKRTFDDRVIVSLPGSYKTSIDEDKLFNSLDIEILYVPDAFTLAEAIIYILNVTAENEKTLRLLHGDTLIEDLPKHLDCLSVGNCSSDYNWEPVNTEASNSDTTLVWAGFFSFSNCRQFLKSLALSRGDFVSAVHIYEKEIGLSKILCESWHDLGHINSYFTSRSRITTERSFNEISIKEGVLYKSSIDSNKIKAEARWFKEIPTSLKKYTPHLLEEQEDAREPYFYALEYLPHLPLNELYVHGRKSTKFWMDTINSITIFLKDSRAALKPSTSIYQSIKNDASSLYRKKTLDRFNKFLENKTENPPEIKLENQTLTIHQAIEICIEKSESLPIIPAILHGDLCFSNILFDSRTGRVKLIDPRGLSFDNKNSIYGDQKYDLAKLAHSIIGLYDFIIAGRYSIEKNNDGSEFIQFDTSNEIRNLQEKFFNSNYSEEVTTKDIMPIVFLLFISMLPLHSDRKDRQRAMLLNAIRIYKDYVVPEIHSIKFNRKGGL
jgi:fructosamine-3-kinase